MSISDWIMIIVGSICLFAGYGFGLWEGGRNGYKKRLAEEEQEKALKPAEESRAKPTATPTPAPVIPDNPGLLRLQETSGLLQLELEGRSLDVDLISSDQRKRLIELITRLRPWIEGRGAPAAVTPPPAPKAAPAPARTSPLPVAKKEETLAPQSMVAQIDAILQARIANTPLADIGLSLVEASGGGVTVLVGDKAYAGIGEVSDPAVQAVIRAAIAEWEKKFTPG